MRHYRATHPDFVSQEKEKKRQEYEEHQKKLHGPKTKVGRNPVRKLESLGLAVPMAVYQASLE